MSFALALYIPFLLPYMHERYFFAADVLSIAYAATHKKRWFVPAAVVAASLNGYLDYLMNFTLAPWSVLVAALLICCAVSVYDVYAYAAAEDAK